MPRLPRRILLAALLGLAAASAHAAVLYSENFNSSTSNPSNYYLNNLGWGAHVTGAAVTNSGTTDPLNWTIVSGGPGSAVTDPANVNAGTNNNNTANNGASLPSRTSLASLVGGSGPAISWTEEFTLDTSAHTINSISFATGNSSSALNTRVAVRIGGAWYVTSATFNQTTPPGSSSNISAYETKTFTWTNAASSWRALSFDGDMTVAGGVSTTLGGTTLGLGSTLGANLPGGNVEAFGLFYDNFGASQTARTNVFTVDATPVPEPATYTALAGFTALGLVASRRRRSAR